MMTLYENTQKRKKHLSLGLKNTRKLVFAIMNLLGAKLMQQHK